MKSETILQAFFYSFREEKTFLNYTFTSPAFQCNSELTSTMTYSEIHLVGSQETWMPILAPLHHQVTMHWPSPDPHPSAKTPFECSSFMWFLPCHTLLPLTLVHLIKLFHMSLGVSVFDFVLYYTWLLTHCSCPQLQTLEDKKRDLLLSLPQRKHSGQGSQNEIKCIKGKSL